MRSRSNNGSHQNAGPNGFGGWTCMQGNVKQTTGMHPGYVGRNSRLGSTKQFYDTSHDYGGRTCGNVNSNCKQFLSQPSMSIN
jgi:hypothetical protein